MKSHSLIAKETNIENLSLNKSLKDFIRNPVNNIEVKNDWENCNRKAIQLFKNIIIRARW